MSKSWTVIIALLALVAGAAGASWFWEDAYNRSAGHALLMRTQADITTRVAALQHLRAGRPEQAGNLLETLLDSDLILAAALAQQGFSFNGNTCRNVALEASARAATGYVPASEALRNAVADALRAMPAARGCRAQGNGR